ncbi:MAG: PhnD/SsuA/transferrin family substrate-binding protein [Polaromonas sp.]|nr:PhnD/SsuA/transferrin family substrate-binding protein [Polaromonas sp.]
MLLSRHVFLLGALLMGVGLLLHPFLAGASNTATVRIGVLAYKGAEAVQDDWSHVRNWLEASIPDHRFVLLDFDQAGLMRAVHEQAIDFVITNSGHYVALENSDGASRIATIESPWALSSRQSIGSAIVVRNDARLHTLADLVGKHVLAVDPEAFGGYQIAARELLQAGVDPEHDLAKLQFTGFPIQKIVHAVRAGQADAGIIRTCLLEQMIGNGEIGEGELRVLAPIVTQGLRCQTSSRLYPDWPFAALRHTPAELTKRVAMALLAMPRTADGYSWTIPSDYQVVDELFRELKIGPYGYLRQWTFEGVMRRYWGWILLILALLVVWAVHTVRVEYLVSQRTRALRAAQEEQRRMAEEALMRQATLDHTARLAILGEMASAIAHELNQPLAAIRNFARGMARRITAGRLEPLPLLEGTGEIVTQSERAASIVRNIRAFAQKRVPEQKSIDLITVLGEAIALFSGAHPQAHLIWQPAATQAPAKVMADSLQIQQVMLNLLKNALDAQQTAGHAQTPIELQLREEAGAYLVTVRDSGCGLKPEQFAHLFEPFFTTKPEGLGLGLSLSKGIIESFGGTLSAMSNDDDAGLTVWFSLPKEESPGGP